ncbi:hypothetical protein F4821DRAFT_213744 [Hypoxylon rubiginosum]|uniref:Uncharacterized protein n=1 Tax=Hypoxylon rubiginosum TaxID=110542 RepID=A0ACC0CQ88_9PEZI|nr:hypothetical protein F4821DRAFT_213744 [Hypoxylon rubiginosum]
MSRLSPLPTNLHRSQSVASVATSNTTYHSFNDIELYEPPPVSASITSRGPQHTDDKFEFKPILRHDSGYESIHSGSKPTTSQSSQRRKSTISTNSSQARPRTRPSIHRANKSTPNPHIRRLSAQHLHLTQSQQQPTTYYCFPPPESLSGEDDDVDNAGPSYPPPPQTTHYWTSDHTRRLEYAAIDAASQGVKGWFMKHVVPDCFVPKSSRRVGFDDDTGSVRRYRLELDCDEAAEKGENGGKKLGWLLGR